MLRSSYTSTIYKQYIGASVVNVAFVATALYALPPLNLQGKYHRSQQSYP